MLSDVLQPIKSELNYPHFARIVYMYSRNIQDPSVPFNAAAAYVRTLSQFIDPIARSNEATPKSMLINSMRCDLPLC